MKNKKAFTLIEIVIVTLIIGLLAGILFKTYITISQISFRVEQQKIVNQELFFISEVMQNFANRNKIDYSRYFDLNKTKGVSDVLYMSGEDGIFSIYSHGDCLNLDQLPTQDDLQNSCNIVLEKDGKIINLTNDLVYVSKVLFKIVPFMDFDKNVDNINLCETNYLACFHNYGFWFFTKIYTRGYNSDNWTNNVSLFIQQFFNI